jgi:spermidine synthase
VTQPGRDAKSPWALYLIFFASGAAGLVYEVMWARSFGLVFGSTTRAAAVVLAAFFLGMALGNWLGARFAVTTRAAALRRYAWLELAIAAAALLVLAWLAVYHGVYPHLYRVTFDAPAALSAVQLGLAALALAPPCIGMGATLPLMSRAVVASEAHLGRRLGLVYALNTLGGVTGVLLAGFWLPVALGVRGSMLLAALLNGLAALAAFGAARGLPSEATRGLPSEATAAIAERRPLPSLGGRVRSLALVAALSGFGTLALEVLFTRLLVNAMDSSVFSFALVLATFLVALALGSALVSSVVDRVRSPWTLIAAGAGLGAAAIVIAPALLTQIWLTSFDQPFWLGALGTASLLLPITALVMGPPALLIGTVLPATWRAAITRAEDAGALVGRLTGVNTLLGVVGSLAAGFVLIPALGTGTSLLLVALLYAALAVVAALRTRKGRSGWLVAFGIAFGFALLAGQRTWEITPTLVPPGQKLVALDEGEGATVTVLEGERGERELVVNSRYTLGGTDGGHVHRSQGELALALHGAPKAVAFIGVATGMSMTSILSHPEIERVVAIELLPGVLRLAEWFDDANGGVLHDPRVELQLADGRNHLFGTDERFDAIVGDLFVPWHAGTGYLYTAEHFANVRERLREGGVFAQWLQLDQASIFEIQSLAASFTTAFDDAELWLNSLDRGRPLLAFVGFRARSEAGRGPGLDPVSRVCGAEVLREWSSAAPANTDDRPVIEFSAAASHYGSASQRVQDGLAAVAWLRAEQQRRWAASD